MLTPLGFASKGFKQPGSKTHLNASASTLKTAYVHCNNLLSETAAERLALVKDEKTVTGTFDNYQLAQEKKYQGDSKSGIMHRGTAYIFKRDKALVLPVGTVLQSQNNIRYVVTRVDPQYALRRLTSLR